MKRLALLACLAGCLGPLRQQAVEYTLNKVAEARDQNLKAAEAAVAVAREVETAAKEERAANLAEPLTELATALEASHAALEEGGKTLAVVQEDVGRAATPVTLTPEQAEAFRQGYRMAVQTYKAMLAWAKRMLPAGAGKLLPGPTSPGKGWTPAEIIAAVTAIVTAVGGAEAGRRGIKSVKVRHASTVETAHAETAEAMGALDELKDKYPADVKAACDPAKRPLLRQAFVRRENGA